MSNTEKAGFVRDTEPFRRELLAHCYRMTGSVHDAEDVVQETYLRAWRAYDRFEGRSSLRTWLYRIATNACLTALERRGRRELPSGLGGPSDDPDAPLESAEPDVAWLQPIHDEMVAPDPAEVVADRESIRLALVASLQYLPPRQRAVLLLREVLAFPAAEVASMLGTTAAAVKSTLQRARARIDEAGSSGGGIVEPSEPEARALLDRYIAAFENSDPVLLEQLLRTDATLEATPNRVWFSGRGTCLPFLVNHVMKEPGYWRMFPTSANGQPAVVAYWGGEPYGVIVLTLSATGIARINSFGDPKLVGTFGFPAAI